MGRYYQTDRPDFVQDAIMRPDYNLLERSLATTQKDYDTQQAVADKIMNINFNHLNSEEENENASTAKDYYLQNANRIASLMMADKDNYRKYLGELKDLTRELQMDFSEGAIAKMQASYNQEKQWREENKETLKTDPALYNALYREAQKGWGGNSITNGIWNQENALKNFDQQKIEDNIQKLTADIKKNSVQTTDGRYKTTIDNEVKYLTEDDILNYAVNKVLSNPETLAYFRQAQRVGIGDYFNPDGTINLKGGQLGSWLQGLRSYAYKQESFEQKKEEDKYGLITAEEASKRRLAKEQWDREHPTIIPATESYSESLYGSPEEFSNSIKDIENKRKLYAQAEATGNKTKMKEYALTDDEQSKWDMYNRNIGKAVLDNIDTYYPQGIKKIKDSGLEKIGVNVKKLRDIKYKNDKGEELSPEESKYLNDSLLKIGKSLNGSSSENRNRENIFNEGIYTTTKYGLNGVPYAVSDVVDSQEIFKNFRDSALRRSSEDINTGAYNINKIRYNLDFKQPELSELGRVLDNTLEYSTTNQTGVVTRQNGKEITSSGDIGEVISGRGFLSIFKNDPNYKSFAEAYKLLKEKYGKDANIMNSDMFTVQSVYGTNSKELYITVNPQYINNFKGKGNTFKITTNGLNVQSDKYFQDKVVKSITDLPEQERPIYIANSPITQSITADITKSVVEGNRSSYNLRNKQIEGLQEGVVINTVNKGNYIETDISYKDPITGKVEPINIPGLGTKFQLRARTQEELSSDLGKLGNILSTKFIFEK